MNVSTDTSTNTLRMSSLCSGSVVDGSKQSGDRQNQPPIGTPQTSIQQWRSLLDGMVFSGDRTKPITAQPYSGSTCFNIPIESFDCPPSLVMPYVLSAADRGLIGATCSFTLDRAYDHLSKVQAQDLEIDARGFNHWYQCADPDTLFRKSYKARPSSQDPSTDWRAKNSRHTCRFAVEDSEAMFILQNRKVGRFGKLTSRDMPTLRFVGSKSTMLKLREYARSPHFAETWGLEVVSQADSEDPNRPAHCLSSPPSLQHWTRAPDALFGSGEQPSFIEVPGGTPGRSSHRLIAPQSYLQDWNLSGDILLRVSLQAAQYMACARTEDEAVISLRETLERWESDPNQESFTRTLVHFLNVGDSASNDKPSLQKYDDAVTRSLFWSKNSFLIQSLRRGDRKGSSRPTTSFEVTFDNPEAVRELKGYVQAQAESQLHIRDPAAREPPSASTTLFTSAKPFQFTADDLLFHIPLTPSLTQLINICTSSFQSV